MGTQGTPCWYELTSHDLEAASSFYGAVLGWSVEGSGMPGMDYRIASTRDGGGVAGLSPAQEGAAAGDAQWLIYLAVDSTDETVAAIAADGGAVLAPPADIPGTGRFAIVADPQGARLGVLQPLPMQEGSDGGSAFDPERHGHGTWHELMTSDPQAAGDFYVRNFAWTPGQVLDMGAEGQYALYGHEDHDIAGIMSLGEAPAPMWIPYFVTEDGITTAAEAITAAGGAVHHGPAQIPGGSMIVIAQDPQGAAFGIVGSPG